MSAAVVILWIGKEGVFDGRHGACLIFVELFADDACVRGPLVRMVG